MLSDKLIQTESQPGLRKMTDRNASGQAIQPTQPAKPGGWGKTFVISALCLVVVVAGIWLVRRRQAATANTAGAARMGPVVVPIVAGIVAQKDVPIYMDGLGTVQAFNTVTVHVRVDGQLKKVAFVEGQDVHVGDVLALIDPDPYQAALEQAKAKKAQDQAQLANAQADMKREVDLYAAKVDSQQVYDTQKALVDQLAAAVQADQAGIDSAQVNLNYTTVTSPIEGRTGIRQVDQGNIVHAADTGGLVVLTQLKPISVVFTLPEQDLEDIHKEMAASGQALKVLAVGRDNSTLLGEGILAVIDNEIDPSTATLRLKANFPNENLGLWPGQFVNTRLQLTTRKDALVVPAAAIQRGPDGAYVFVITNAKGGKGSAGKHPDGSATAEAGPKSRPAAGATTPPGKPGDSANQEILSVKIQPVTVAAQIEAGEALVESGLKKGDRIVVDGQYKLQDGSQVKISPAKAAKVDSGPEDGIQ